MVSPEILQSPLWSVQRGQGLKRVVGMSWFLMTHPFCSVWCRWNSRSFDSGGDLGEYGCNWLNFSFGSHKRKSWRTSLKFLGYCPFVIDVFVASLKKLTIKTCLSYQLNPFVRKNLKPLKFRCYSLYQMDDKKTTKMLYLSTYWWTKSRDGF